MASSMNVLIRLALPWFGVKWRFSPDDYCYGRKYHIGSFQQQREEILHGTLAPRSYYYLFDSVAEDDFMLLVTLYSPRVLFQTISWLKFQSNDLGRFMAINIVPSQMSNVQWWDVPLKIYGPPTSLRFWLHHHVRLLHQRPRIWPRFFWPYKVTKVGISWLASASLASQLTFLGGGYSECISVVARSFFRSQADG